MPEQIGIIKSRTKYPKGISLIEIMIAITVLAVAAPAYPATDNP